MRIMFLVMVLSVFLPLSASAQEFFFEAFGGKRFNLDADLFIDLPEHETMVEVFGVEWRDESFTPPIYWGLGFGYFFESKPWLGVRVQFVHNKVIALTNQTYRFQGTLDGEVVDRHISLDEVVEFFEVTHGMNSLVFSPVARRGFAGGRAHIFGGVGMGPTFIHPEGVVRGVYRESGYMLGPLAQEVFFGSSVRVYGRLTLSTEYKFLLVAGATDMPVAGGALTTDFVSHQLVFGARFGVR